MQVGFGAVDGNRNPVLTAEAPSAGLSARSNVVFNARATDPDGDALYYRWDFGDGSLQPNLASITQRFPKGAPTPCGFPRTTAGVESTPGPSR